MAKKPARDSSEEDDPETLARIKLLERGRKGFKPQELGKVVYRDNVEQLQFAAAPFNPKLDKIVTPTEGASESTVASTDGSGPPKEMFGPRSIDCPCCEMEVRTGAGKFLFLKCCRMVFHEKCIGVWLMCSQFCPNKKCNEIIKLAQYFN